MGIKHLHARHHSSSGAFAPVIKFDSGYVFEAAITRQMCTHLGVGVQFPAPYAHHILGKAERPWRTIRDNASAMLHNMAVPNSMWSCAVSTVVYLRNRTYNRSVGPNGGILLTLLTLSVRDASKFRVFGCAVFAKVPDKLHRKLSEKAFRGVWLATPMTHPGTVCTTRRHAASPLPSMLSFMKTPRASAHSSPSTRSSPTFRMTHMPPHSIPTPSTSHCQNPNPVMQPLAKLGSVLTPFATATWLPTCPTILRPS
jgi:hypothetical protein